MRILRLLEEHHRKLALIVKSGSSLPAESVSIKDVDEAGESAGPQEVEQAPLKTLEKRAASPHRVSSAVAAASGRTPPRELKSSIATNLASARGIPARQQRRGLALSPTVSPQNARGQAISTDKAPNLKSSPLKNPGAEPKSRAETRKTDDVKTSSTPPADSFQTFYSTFENLFSKLSAPLVFAGLPLGDTEEEGRKTSSDRATSEPDVERIFSRAALQAVRDERGHIGPGGESFYVVPTSGGSASYARIAGRSQEEEFFDARTSPLSSADSRRFSRNTKTMEELVVENQALKKLTDDLSRRLHGWEVNAQMSSLALHQSIRAMSHASPTPSEGGGDDRAREMEEKLKGMQEELARMEKENEKLKTVVSRYRSKWDSLKAGAKQRREAT